MEADARKRQFIIWYVFAAMIGILLFQQFWTSYTQVETIAYSQFERLLKSRQGSRGDSECRVGPGDAEGALAER